MRRGKCDHLLELAFQAQVARNGCGGVAQLAVHGRERLVVRMPEVHAHRDLAGNHVARIRLDLHEAHRATAIGSVAPRDDVDRFYHPGGAAHGVVTRFHRSRPGVRILTGPDAIVPTLTQRAGYHADHFAFRFKDRPLLDVRLEVRIDRARADRRRARVADLAQSIA